MILHALSSPPRSRGVQCPPPAVLEALSAGEPVPAEVEHHLPTCPECRGYLAALADGREAFLKQRPPELFLRQLDCREAAGAHPAPSPRRSRRSRLAALLRPRWAAPTFAGAAVAAAVAALLIVRPASTSSDPVVRWKGTGLHVVYLRSGMEAPEPLAPDERVRPGDALRFAYGAASDGYLLILEIDGTGRASVFHPYGGPRSVPMPADQRDFLDGSVVLDNAPGPEWLVAVFSNAPVDAAPLLRQLESEAGTAEPRVSCPGCRVSALRLQKEP